jgi:hypothetical protein
VKMEERMIKMQEHAAVEHAVVESAAAESVKWALFP